MPELTVESAGKAEPNLTPLLDVVLQLLMFFVISVNFKTAQFKGEVKLPHTQSAAPFEKTDESKLIVNVKPFFKDNYKNRTELLEKLSLTFYEGDSMVSIPFEKEQQHRRIVDMRFWFIQKYKDLLSEAEARGESKVETTIILRADNATNYKDVYDLMQMVKNANFRKVKLGATYSIGERQ